MSGRLLFVAGDADSFRSHRLALAIAAQEAGFDVHVALPAGGTVAPEVEARRFAMHRFAFSRASLSPRHSLRAIASLTGLMRRVGPDLVHTFSPQLVVLGGLAARAAGVPALVSGVTGLGIAFTRSDWRGRLVQRGILLGMRAATLHPRNHVLLQNEDDLALLESRGVLGRTPSTVIHGSGVDVDRFAPSRRSERTEPPVVMFASRMLWSKGVGSFVAAARRLRARGSAARFVLVGGAGDPSPDAVPPAQLADWDDEGVVEWWGRREDMAATLGSATLFCLPTVYREGVPKVLIEAAACGLPLVTSDAPGCRSVVREGWNGRLVQPGDDQGLSEAIEEMLSDPAQLLRQAENSREIAFTDFSLDAVLPRTLAVYRDLLASGQNKGESAFSARCSY